MGLDRLDAEEELARHLGVRAALRDQAAVDGALEDLRGACTGTENLLVPMRAALKVRASIGEVCGVMREEFGEYSEA